MHPKQITTWKDELLARATEIFCNGTSAQSEQDKIRELQEKICELTVKREFFDHALGRFLSAANFV